ncbi:MAG: two-component system sensor histidine kinase AtoS [Hyphomicrobiales bacterium]|nr:two-component system sensor histidine kinase AtoS [Hyphomicrobiales bacterium]
MRRWTRETFLPIRNLRHRLIATSLVVVALPITMVAVLLVFQERDAILSEKEDKLFALTRILDADLGPGFDAIVAERAPGARDRATALKVLAERLSPIADRVAAADPGVGVGYYSRKLDAIVTYGPNAEYGNTIGLPIAADHPGRKVMESGEARIETGLLVRGSILNAMLPLVRDGKVIGYAWANETTEAIGLQQRVIVLAVGVTSLFGLVVAFGVVWWMSRGLSQEVDVIVDGLEVMQTDLRHRIPPLRDELGDIVRAINGMAKALSDARSLTENILASIADGIVAVDRGGVVTALNPAAEALYGKTAEAAIGRSYRELFASSMPHSALLETLESGRARIGITLDFRRDDRSLKLDVSSSVLRDGDGKPIGAVVVLKDVSERDRLMNQVMRADRLAGLGELTAGIAHEIRNPLTSIRGFLQYLQECESPEEWRRYGPMIIREVDSLNHIVGELLAFGRPRPPQIDRLHVDDLIKEVAFLARGKSDAPIELKLAADLPVMEGDRESLKQAILNLLINAIQAIPAAGTVEVSAEAVADQMIVRVSDDGVGIPPDNIRKIFDPFFSTKASGTGLGLAMVHRIVDAHGGEISVESLPDVGTTIELRLPLTRPAAETPT